MGVRGRLGALALAALAVASPAAAQQEFRPRVGIGIELTNLGNVYVPIDLAPNLRLEPLVGVGTIDRDAGVDVKEYALGIGAFYVVPVGQQAHLYVGPRVGFRRLDETDPPNTTIKATDWWIGAALGGEFLAHPRVGFGGEAEILYASMGKHEATAGGPPEVVQRSATAVGTQGLVFVRFYLL